MGVRVSCPIFQREGLDACRALYVGRGWTNWRIKKYLVGESWLRERLSLLVRAIVLKRLEDR